jgi:hypothetical protein
VIRSWFANDWVVADAGAATSSSEASAETTDSRISLRRSGMRVLLGGLVSGDVPRERLRQNYPLTNDQSYSQSAPAIISAPQPARITPATRPNRSPAGAAFSSKMRPAMAATQIKFITPATKSRVMRDQQQPAQ